MIYISKIIEPGRENEKKVSRSLLAYALHKEYGIPENRIYLQRNASGKPFLKDIEGVHFSLSHTDGLATVTVASGETGIDVEKIKDISMRVADRVCTQSEKQDILKSADPDIRFLSYWTLKESYVKATGTGLSFGLKNISFDISGGLIRSNAENAEFRQVMHGDYIISVCGLGFKPDCFITEVNYDRQLY